MITGRLRESPRLEAPRPLLPSSATPAARSCSPRRRKPATSSKEGSAGADTKENSDEAGNVKQVRIAYVSQGFSSATCLVGQEQLTDYGVHAWWRDDVKRRCGRAFLLPEIEKETSSMRNRQTNRSQLQTEFAKRYVMRINPPANRKSRPVLQKGHMT